MGQQIVVTISPEGDTKIEAIGYTGGSCAAATKPLEEALGVVADRKLKPEYHRAPVAVNQKVGQK
jgi:hypothetical protein